MYDSKILKEVVQSIKQSLIRLDYFKQRCNFTADLELWMTTIRLENDPWRFYQYEALEYGHKFSPYPE